MAKDLLGHDAVDPTSGTSGFPELELGDGGDTSRGLQVSDGRVLRKSGKEQEPMADEQGRASRSSQAPVGLCAIM